MIHRRDLLTAAIAGGGSTFASIEFIRAEQRSPKLQVIDTNVHLFRWPFRRLPLDETSALVAKLNQLKIGQAWAGSYEGVFHHDLSAANERLTQVCQNHLQLVPIGTVNPRKPGWRKDVLQCLEKHRMPGIRLYPGYHGYQVDDSKCIELVRQVAAIGRFIQIVGRLEDSRTQHPLARVPNLDLNRLPGLMRKCPGARVQLLNESPRGSLLKQLAAVPELFFDTARVDSTDGLAAMLKVVPEQRMLFGTHAPFLIPEAALIRLVENRLSAATLRLVAAGNAKQWIA